MTNRWMQLLEAHVEKGLLGLAGLFTLFMLWTYMLNSPNKVTYSGQDLGPRELMERIKTDADQLDAAVRNAKPADLEPMNFSEKLSEQYAQGIFGESQEGSLALPERLPRVASFGQPIEVPGLAESEGAEAAGALVLATPLRPSQPKLRTGRSLAVEEQRRIEIEGKDDVAAATEQPPTKEVAWVSIASYFNKKAQYDEMIKAGYANYRANAYIAGQEVQRQEILSTGEFSDWQDVTPGKAMPKCDLPDPQFDDETGELINKDEIRQTFALVKVRQDELMQPPFYLVEAGDFWSVPELAGYEDNNDEEDKTEEDAIEKDTGKRGNVSTGRNTGRGRGSSSPGRGRGSSSPGRDASGTGGPSPASDPDREARKQLREDLKQIRVLLGKKEYDEAARLAEQVKNNGAASKGDQRNAKELLKIAQHWLDVRDIREGRGKGRAAEETELIVNPETNEPAIWFHDDSVVAGKTYRYRMRVKLWNRYVGRTRALKDPAQAKQSIVLGEWSYPSDPITVTPSKYFFLSGGKQPDTASFDVWTWRKGRWLKQRFEVTVGDAIGGAQRMKTGEYDAAGAEIETEIDFRTGAVVLDLRFDEPVSDRWPQKDGMFEYRDKTSMVLTYLDPADGQVKERLLLYDSKDPKNKELKDQAW